MRVGREQCSVVLLMKAEPLLKKVLGVLKDCDEIKLEGVVTTVDQKSFDWISCLLW